MNTLVESQFTLALKAYRSKIRVYAGQHFHEIPGYTHEDLEQELSLVLFKVVLSYNPSKGAKFNTYFWQCVRNKQVDLVTKAKAEKRTCEWFSAFDDESREHFDELSASVFDDASLTPEDWYLLKERAVEIFTASAA